jgi:MmgE/PrpD N-terminal domain
VADAIGSDFNYTSRGFNGTEWEINAFRSVVSSALAVGEQFAIDGMRFLRSVALGYDIGPRITITLGKLQYMVETHRSTHALCGSFGSAAAAACAAGLTAQQMRWVLSYKAQEAGGLASWQRHGPHREIIRLWRHAGAQRSHGRFAGGRPTRTPNWRTLPTRSSLFSATCSKPIFTTLPSRLRGQTGSPLTPCFRPNHLALTCRRHRPHG